MKVFGLGDLHLSLSGPFNPQSGETAACLKPMDIFGRGWQGYVGKIYHNWRGIVGPADAVLVPGDISWGMSLEDCTYDWDFLAQLPGTIYICRGNHDYWWQGIGKVRQSLPPNVVPLNHDSAVVGGRAVCATRGWLLPGVPEWKGHDEVVYKRELLRLEMALTEGAKHNLPLVAMTHYMPLYKTCQKSDFTALMEQYGVTMSIYGHLHGEDCARTINGNYFGIDFVNLSCDCLEFVPRLLWEG